MNVGLLFLVSLLLRNGLRFLLLTLSRLDIMTHKYFRVHVPWYILRLPLSTMKYIYLSLLIYQCQCEYRMESSLYLSFAVVLYISVHVVWRATHVIDDLVKTPLNDLQARKIRRSPGILFLFLRLLLCLLLLLLLLFIFDQKCRG
jgi:hypothetical protein